LEHLLIWEGDEEVAEIVSEKKQWNLGQSSLSWFRTNCQLSLKLQRLFSSLFSIKLQQE
jgi:hypothetical protein